MWAVHRVCLALLCGPLLTGCGLAPSAGHRALSAAEARALFSDRTVTGRHHKKGYTFRSYYDPSGVFRSYQNGARKPKLGRWRVDAQGNVCIRWQGSDQELCRKIVVDQKGNYTKVLVKGGTHVLIVSYDGFVEGNPDNL